MSLNTAEIRAGTPLAGRYRVLRRLGTGGMATVFLAEDERLGREVAIKRLHTDAPEASLRRFEQEAKLGAALNHPNLVAIYDTVAAEEGALIVMEYVSGKPLSELAGRPMRRSRALPILRSVADALDHAHAAGVVHRDVKPGNVLVGDDGTVKLADLGIARAIGASQITSEGSVVGTLPYMSPERLAGPGAGGPESDVYALAAVAYELLSGRPPSEAASTGEAARGADPTSRATGPKVLPAAVGRARAGPGRRARASASPRRGGWWTSSRPRCRRAARRRPPAAGPATTRVATRARTATRPRTASGADRRSLGPRAGRGAAGARPAGGRRRRAQRRRGRTIRVPGAPASSPPRPSRTPPPRSRPARRSPQPTPAARAGSRRRRPRRRRAQRPRLLPDQRGPLRRGDPGAGARGASFPEGSDGPDLRVRALQPRPALRLAGRPEEAIPVLEQRLEIPNQTRRGQARAGGGDRRDAGQLDEGDEGEGPGKATGTARRTGHDEGLRHRCAIGHATGARPRGRPRGYPFAWRRRPRASTRSAWRRRRLRTVLARADRAAKDACLRDLADRIEARSAELLEANAADVEAGREEGLTEALIDRLALTDARIAEMAAGRARDRRAGGPGRRDRRELDAGERAAGAEAAGAAGRDRDRLRGAAERDHRRRGAVPEERQRGRAARVERGRDLQRDAGRPCGGVAGADRVARGRGVAAGRRRAASSSASWPPRRGWWT